jgi:hypothetical protein
MWYAKERATFSDTIAMVRRWLWIDQHCQMSKTKVDMMKVVRVLFERLTEMLCYVAKWIKSRRDSLSTMVDGLAAV